MSPHREPFLRAAGAVIGGGLLYLASPPAALWWLAPLGPALLLLAVRGIRLRTAYLLGFGCGIAYLAPLLTWAQAPGVDAWIWLTLFEALLFALLGPALVLVNRLRSAWLVAGGSAAVWVGGEAIRDRFPFGGLPWDRLAFTQPDTPFTRLAALGGAPLVSFAVALCGCLLAVAALRARRRALLAAGSAFVLSLCCVAAGWSVTLPGFSRNPTIVVAAVQGDVPGHGYAPFRRATAVLDSHIRETYVLARAIDDGSVAAPDLVIWPENSADVDPLYERNAFVAITSAQAAVRAPLLVGAILNGPSAKTGYNAGIVWGTGGPTGQVYLKQHPVPFGEYLPWRGFFEAIAGRFKTLLPFDLLPGHRPGDLVMGSTTVGDVICFEVAFDGIVRATVTGGARLLVVQTNNATFGHTGESAQQVAMAQLRAVEHDRSVVVDSTVGISAIIDPDGRIIARTATFVPAFLEASVPLVSTTTLADRVGGLPELVLVTLAILAVAGGAVTGRVQAARSQQRVSENAVEEEARAQ